MIASEPLSTAKYTDLQGVTSSSTYKCGALKSCMFDEENILESPAGTVIPQFSEPIFGERQKKHRSSIDFHRNGEIKSVALDKQMPLATPVGMIDAELITFYEDGSVNRIFPLNGLIDGYWSEASERGMAEVLELDLPTGLLKAKVISLHFYPNGEVKTVTVWPGEALKLNTPVGPQTGRAGFSLYEGGALRSFEPAGVIQIPTPVGPIKAFDPDIIGMHADQNSVQFDASGQLTSVVTMHSGIRITNTEGKAEELKPYEAASYIDVTELRTVPIKIEFTETTVRIHERELREFELDGNTFETFERKIAIRDACANCPGNESADCCQNGGSCGGCGGSCG